MSRYHCITPDGREAWVEADSEFLAEAVAAVSLELDDLPSGSVIAAIGGAA